MRALLLVVSTIMLALLLSILTMPSWSLWARPEWTLLVLIYWALALPERCGVLVAAVTGLMLDSLTGDMLGKHMLAYSLVIGIVIAMHKRFRMFDIWYQARIIFFLIVLEYFVIYIIDRLLGNFTHFFWFVFPALISALIWPWMMIALRGLRRKFGLMVKLP